MPRRNRVPESVSMETPKARKAEERRRREIEDRRRIEDLPSVSARDPNRPVARRVSLPEALVSKLPTGASRDAARMALHGLARTGNTILRAIDIPNRVFGNTRSLLQDIYERSEANLARDAYEDRSGAPQVGETAVHLASAGVLGKALPAVFGANVSADTYETAKYAGASEGEALAKGLGHGAVDTAIWTLGQGLASKYLPKAWQWLGREITGAGRGAASSVTSDAVLNSLGADISGEEMAKRAVHAAWMVPLLGMLKMGGKRREEAMSLLRKARPDLAGEKADKVIETIEAEFADPKSQKVALAWVTRKGANLPDDTAQIRQALEVSSKVKGFDPMSKSPFEILSNPAYARYLPKPRPQDVKAFSNMKRYPMGVIGFDVSDDAAGRQATREMINAYMSPSSNPWCLATGKDAAKLGELGPEAESYWKSHSTVPKQIFFQEVDGKLELTAFRATSPGGEGWQEYWDTSDAGYSGIPLKVKVPGDPMGRYRKMVFRPAGQQAPDTVRLTPNGHVEYNEEQLHEYIAGRRHLLETFQARPEDFTPDAVPSTLRDIELAERGLETLARRKQGSADGEVQGTFEDIAPGKVFKGDPFRDGRSQTWVSLDKQEQQKSDGTGVGIGHSVSEIDGPIDIVVGREGGQFPTIEAARAELQRVDSRPLLNDFEASLDEIAEDREYYSAYRQALVQAIEGAVRNSRPVESNGDPTIEIAPDLVRGALERRHLTMDIDGLRALRGQMEAEGASGELDVIDDTIENVSDRISSVKNRDPYILVEDKLRTTENGITKFRTTKYADPTEWDYEPPKPGEQPKPVEIEESELVSPEWMRSRGYDPESESDVRRMQQELGIRAWGNGVEAAMAVVPTKRTYMQTRSGTPETVTYGSNGRDIVSVDFIADGVPYRTEYFNSGPTSADPSSIYHTIGFDEFPSPLVNIGSSTPTGSRLTRNPDSSVPEVLNEVKWDDGLGSFIRTSGNRRWRTPNGEAARLAGEELLHETWESAPASRREWAEPPKPTPPKIIVEDRQPDGTWAHVETYDDTEEIPFALKAGNTRRDVQVAAKGGDTRSDANGGDTGPAEDESIPEPGGTPVSSPAGGGPRIVINPSTFRNEKDALCVAFNEAFRLVMEEMGFNPVAEPTEAQRRFFGDTAYRDDELQLRRTILARICTFDTSVKDPTDEQLQEAVEFLTSVMEAGAPQNEWEQRAVMRLRDVISHVSAKGTRGDQADVSEGSQVIPGGRSLQGAPAGTEVPPDPDLDA